MKIFSLFTSKANDTPEAVFWTWFEDNENELFHCEKDTDSILHQLQAELAKVNSLLVFDFSTRREDTQKAFIISANGSKKAFPFVEQLYDAAPTLSRWKVIKFRQKKALPSEVSQGGISINSADVHYNLYKDMNKMGVVVFFNNYNENQKDAYARIGSLFLGAALGEYDVVKKLDFIEFRHKDSEHFDGAKPIAELAAEVAKFARR